MSITNQTVSSVSTTVELITPDMAAKYLENNASNRPIRPVHVRMFEQLQLNNDFQHTHQGIALSSEGDKLLDGQHRLTAIVNSGIPCLMNVTRGLPESTYQNMDAGIPRSVSDRVTFDDSPPRNAKIVAVCVALVNLLSKGTGNKNLCRTHSAQAVQRMYEEYRASISAIMGIYFGLPFEQVQAFSRDRSVLATLIIYHSKNPVEALDFTTRLLNGLGDVMDPVKMTYSCLSARKMQLVERLNRLYWAINKNHTGSTAKHAGRTTAPYYMKMVHRPEDVNLDKVVADLK